MLGKLRDDSGMAMVTAIMAGLVVLALSTAGFSMASHSLESSAGNRRTVQSVHAAEAGLDRFLEYLANEAPIQGPVCSLSVEDLSATPATSFTVTATYYASNDGTGSALASPENCTTFVTIPRSAVITSKGTSSARTRTMTTLVELQPNNGTPLAQAAVFAGGAATWTGQAAVSNAAGTELAADLYSSTNIEIKGGGTVHGTVEAQGSIALGGTTDVKRNVTARGTLTVKKNATIRGDARSSTASISNNGAISSDAYYCTGSAPGGDIDGSRINGCDPDLPMVKGFMRIGYDATEWTANDPFYTEVAFASCPTDADLDALTGNHVVRITGCPTFTLPNMTVKAHLAIISTGDIRSTGTTNVSRNAGMDPPHALHLMANVPTAPSLADPAACPNSGGITIVAGTTFPPGIDVLFYTPCGVKFTGNSTASIQGQIVAGGDVVFSSGSNLTYKPVLIPTTDPTGFRQSVRYRSEIVG